MYCVFVILLTFVSALTVHSRDLLVLTVSTETNDALERFLRSANNNHFNVKVLGLGLVWKGGDVSHSVGGGQKINLLRDELRNHINLDDLLILFLDRDRKQLLGESVDQFLESLRDLATKIYAVEDRIKIEVESLQQFILGVSHPGLKAELIRRSPDNIRDAVQLAHSYGATSDYDVVFMDSKFRLLEEYENSNYTILFGAESFCWPDQSLEKMYPPVGPKENRFLNSGGFVGPASSLYRMVTEMPIKEDDDDQLYYTKIYLNEALRRELNIGLDTRSSIFQNLNGALQDVELHFTNDTGYLVNTKTGTRPIVAHGNGPIKPEFNSLTNYLDHSWTPTRGCQHCSERNLDLDEQGEFPNIQLSIFIENPTPFLDVFFDRIAALSYPKSHIHLTGHVAKKAEKQRALADAFNKTYGHEYLSVSWFDAEEVTDEAIARDYAYAHCLALDACMFLFSVDSTVQLTNPRTIEHLIQMNRSMIAPMLSRRGKLWSNFWGALSRDGYYERSDDYIEIVERNRTGIWNVPFIRDAYLLSRRVVRKFAEHKLAGSIDVEMRIPTIARQENVFMTVDNLEPYGYLVFPDTYTTDHLNNDLWQIFDNPLDWEEQYVHPDYFEISKPEVRMTDIEQPCPDVFYFPIVSAKFCRQLIAEVEEFGLWSDGTNVDPRLEGGYENPWARMNFVVRYRPDEQSSLRPHHDASSYSLTIALNEAELEFQGGGTRFVRYNCSLVRSKLGWTSMFPGRVTHLHEGLTTTSGTRYIFPTKLFTFKLSVAKAPLNDELLHRNYTNLAQCPCGQCSRYYEHQEFNTFLELLVLTVATESNDALERFLRSARNNEFNVKVLGLGQAWNGGDVSRSTGGGQKIRLLRDELRNYRSDTDLLVLFVDSYDVVFMDSKTRLLEEYEKSNYTVLFGAEGFCWPDKNLANMYPQVGPREKRFLNSGGFIGPASYLYRIVTEAEIADDRDDQLYYTTIYLNQALRVSFRKQPLNARNLRGPSAPLDVDQTDNAPSICSASQPCLKRRQRESALIKVRQRLRNMQASLTRTKARPRTSALDQVQTEQLNIGLDTKSAVFQNLHGAFTEVELQFANDTGYLVNTKTNTRPIVAHGNGPIKPEFNSLTNYLDHSWTPSLGCQHCNERIIDLDEQGEFPTIQLSVFIEYPTPFLDVFFDRIAALSYPKTHIHLTGHIGRKAEKQTPLVNEFIKKHGHSYLSIKWFYPDELVDEGSARDHAYAHCLAVDTCQFMFSVDAVVQLTNPHTIEHLIQMNRSMIAPMLSRRGKLWSNFWGALSRDGYYERSDDYVEIVERKRVGIWNVPFIRDAYLLSRRVVQVFANHKLSGIDGLEMRIPNIARQENIFMTLDNMEHYGYLVHAETYTTEHLNNDLWQIFDNPLDWEEQYVHPDYFKYLAPEVGMSDFKQPCPDVFYLPIVTTKFCRQLIAEVEEFGLWSDGTNVDPRLEGGYENVPTRDIHMRQINWEDHWLHFLVKYVHPIQKKVFAGYEDKPWARMNFVVRYRPDEQASLRPHHDASSYTVNIALNEAGVDFEGGGTGFVRYNCSVVRAKVGWAAIFPGRVTHLHEGLTTTSGTRYIFVTFVNP
ncbi:hypothetical protein T265_06214 [Opisthorchis viverrini]|uniref:Fe2OG dioxygenase domain-containing protein n=1 Tax=Opisthorchis viverrini TaxID=6198 RepID=A0A074ZT65_OPIVI|nr:hypothetical protein T265_06214 [Opisthorchis viverrini]KER26570.1 hypothetical protein T265_06214 [Opisthorchis viverrini]